MSVSASKLKRGLAALAFAAGAITATAAHATESTHSPNRLVFGFLQTVFGSEQDKAWWFSGAGRVKKYTVPVRFFIYNRLHSFCTGRYLHIHF